ncbi:MAG: nuclear transport factor 2 family protein [Ferruginibacter sp.]
MRKTLVILTTCILFLSCNNDTKVASVKNDTADKVLNNNNEILFDKDRKQIEDTIIGLENEWAEVIVNHDMAVLEKVLAPSYVGTGVENSLADVTNKKEMIKMYLSGDHTITSAVNSNMKVYITSKNLAVAIGEVTENGKYNNGKDLYRVWRWTDTYAKLDGRWQCISNHSSRIK